MNLLERDGKALFDRHAIPVPRGALWPDLPAAENGFVVKAQVPAGKRGKGGGIRFANTPEEVGEAARDLLGKTLGEHRIAAIYVEEKLDIARELYLAVALDRDAGCLTLIASADGGMTIEDVPRDRIVTLPIDPLLGLKAFHIAEIARILGTESEEMDGLVRALVGIAEREDAELIEINPLVVLGDGRLFAADSKVVLDDNANFRRAPLNVDLSRAARADSSRFENAVAKTGAVGVDIHPDGDVVAVVSGAGLMMATLDLLRDAGIGVSSVIDLGGSVLAGGESLRRVLGAVATATPRVIFINAFMQTAYCDEFARVLAEAYAASILDSRVVVRLKGRHSEEGRRILQGEGFEVHEDLAPAIGALILRPKEMR